MKRQAVFLFLPIFLVFFIWGLQVGDNLDKKISFNSTNQQINLEKNISTLPNGQKNIFIILVSELDTKTPRLIGIWLMSYMYTEPYSTVMAVYPSPIQNHETQNNRLSEEIKLKNVEGIPQLDNEYREELSSTNIWYSGYILIDLEGINELFTLTGRNTNILEPADPSENHAQVSDLNETTLSSLTNQALVLQQLCNKFTLVESISELKVLRELFPSHISGNLDPDILLGDWLQFINSHNGSFCIFPQKEMLLQINP